MYKKRKKILRRIENIDEIDKEFPELGSIISQNFKELISGNFFGRGIFHLRKEENGEERIG